ncbi:MAG: DNA repair protein [Clostridia bacterium]|nr:DNA repair protein [Clostridia bacterium]
MEKARTYFCIDMKCFYASVECAERGLNPFETPLVVADKERGKNALCLAISPKMKSLGIRNRCRLSEIPKGIDYIVACPRMHLYVEYAARIYGLYLRYMDKSDIHVYSIDEAFLDVTDYLKLYKKTAPAYAKFLLGEIARNMHVPATAGIGENLYLAKIALDITAKHSREHIGVLTEESYRESLWRHRPITDFWQISTGTARRLAHYGLYDMESVAHAPERLLYKEFGVNAELLIDHAWGRESCTIADIKAYKGKSRSVSSSQILPRDYTAEEARIVMMEMTLDACRRLMKGHLVAGGVSIFIGYSFGSVAPTGGRVRMDALTALFSVAREYVSALFEEAVLPDVPIRRLGIAFDTVVDEGCEGYDLFADLGRLDKEKRAEKAALEIRKKMGMNALLRAMDLEEGATAIERNGMIGGHKA